MSQQFEGNHCAGGSACACREHWGQVATIPPPSSPSRKSSLGYWSRFLKKPDIGSYCYLCQVARAQTPKDISVLAQEIGLLPSEVLTTIAWKTCWNKKERLNFSKPRKAADLNKSDGGGWLALAQRSRGDPCHYHVLSVLMQILTFFSSCRSSPCVRRACSTWRATP